MREKWIAFAKENGFEKSALSPLDRFFLKLGLDIPPFVFWNFFVVTLSMAICFYLPFLGFYFVLTKSPGSFQSFFFETFVWALGFGFFMACWNFWKKRKLKVSSWDEFRD